MKSDVIARIEEENLIAYVDQVNMTERDKEIIKIFLSEHPTYRELGDRYEISHERVRQILIKYARKALYFQKKAQQSEK